MTAKTQYWMTDGYGVKALMVGVDERDRWTPLGWSESDEPAAGDRVWMRHEEHGGRAQFAVEAAELWMQKGWQPSDPEPPVNPFNTPDPATEAGRVTATEAAPAESGATPKSASSTSEKR
ncbi:hypothetical protein OOJ91_13710 [Micromonospora lupini]|uniref:hypothetical protein n=1 Tax=Micromonospora lupini TaxID=285679 RepID=UPI0022585764|nr:hypothetical protein [Micromonospora lupini]MCX5066903.1 hypothetical protein [Micromonospora lupini]